MANTVTKDTLQQRGNRVYLHVSVEFDGSGQETDTSLLDISTLTMEDGSTTPTSISVQSIVATVSNVTFIKVETDRTTDQLVALLGEGLSVLDFRQGGGKDDAGSGGTGDLVFTSDGAVDGGVFSAVIVLDLQA